VLFTIYNTITESPEGTNLPTGVPWTLPSISSNAQCTFNGRQLKLALGNIAYDGCADLLKVESCTLEAGVVFGLVGPNGTGKSSFARLLASKAIPGFPSDFTTCYVDSGALSTSTLCSQDFLESAASARHCEIKAQISMLERYLDSDEDLRSDMGVDLRDSNDLSSDNVEALVSRLSFLLEADERLCESKAEVEDILQELGFGSANLLNIPVCDLSSGWRYKCELARALLSLPDLLILDEPSFLDSDSLRWLEERTRCMAHSGAIVILITHKPALHHALADRILFIDANHKLHIYNCGYDSFLVARTDAVSHAKREICTARAKEVSAASSLKHVKARVQKGGNNFANIVATHKYDKRFVRGKCVEAKQNAIRTAASKVKRLKKEATQLAEFEETSHAHETVPIFFTGAAWSESTHLFSVQDVDFSYPPTSNKTALVLEGVSVAVYGGDRIALMGENGAGKSTLLKLLLGQLNPTAGSIQRKSGLRIAYFPQNALQRLLVECGELSAVQFLQCEANPSISELVARSHLGKFGLQGSIATQRIATLSAGQRTRLYLSAQFLSSIAPGVLILDEVENLDVESTDALMESLLKFEGAVICVSHDRTHLEKYQPRQIWKLKDASVLTSLVSK